MSESHLSFLLAGRRHAIPMSSIQELVYVPLLQPTERVSGHILGFFNLRGEPIPVLDLAALLGLATRPVQADDVLLLFRPPSGSGSYGLLAEAVEDLLVFQPEELKPPMEDPLAEALSPVVVWLGLKEERLYHLLDLDLLVATAQSGRVPGRYEQLFGGLEPELLARLQARAEGAVERRLDGGSVRHDFVEILLSGERFAVPLAAILQIAPCPPIYPVPGAPPAILGLANHGGEPMLVVDLRPLLGMPGSTLLPEARLLVIEDGSGALGFYADDVGETLDVDPGSLQVHPAKDSNPLIRGEWLKEGSVFHLLDLPLVLAHPGLTLSPHSV